MALQLQNQLKSIRKQILYQKHIKFLLELWPECIKCIPSTSNFFSSFVSTFRPKVRAVTTCECPERVNFSWASSCESKTCIHFNLCRAMVDHWNFFSTVLYTSAICFFDVSFQLVNIFCSHHGSFFWVGVLPPLAWFAGAFLLPPLSGSAKVSGSVFHTKTFFGDSGDSAFATGKPRFTSTLREFSGGDVYKSHLSEGMTLWLDRAPTNPYCR